MVSVVSVGAPSRTGILRTAVESPSAKEIVEGTSKLFAVLSTTVIGASRLPLSFLRTTVRDNTGISAGSNSKLVRLEEAKPSPGTSEPTVGLASSVSLNSSSQAMVKAQKKKSKTHIKNLLYFIILFDK